MNMRADAPDARAPERDALADWAAIGLTVVAFAGSYATVQKGVHAWGVKDWMSWAIAAMPEVTVAIGMRRVLARTATPFVWVALVTSGAFTLITNLAVHTDNVQDWRPVMSWVVAAWPAWSVVLALGLAGLHSRGHRVAEAAPLEAAPLEAAPLEAAPLEAAPLEAAPLEAAPLEAAPLEAAPALRVIPAARPVLAEVAALEWPGHTLNGHPRPPLQPAAPALESAAGAAPVALATQEPEAVVWADWSARKGTEKAMTDAELAQRLGISKAAARSRRRGREGTK